MGSTRAMGKSLWQPVFANFWCGEQLNQVKHEIVLTWNFLYFPKFGSACMFRGLILEVRQAEHHNGIVTFIAQLTTFGT